MILLDFKNDDLKTMFLSSFDEPISVIDLAPVAHTSLQETVDLLSKAHWNQFIDGWKTIYFHCEPYQVNMLEMIVENTRSFIVTDHEILYSTRLPIRYVFDSFSFCNEYLDINYDNFMRVNGSIGYPHRADVILIGDQFGDASKIGVDGVKAFTDPKKSSSSVFLHQAIYENYATSYYITNARKSLDEQENAKLLFNELKGIRLGTKIITLGSKADDLFRKVMKRVPDNCIPHPSYAKRFKTLTIQSYAELIQ